MNLEPKDYTVVATMSDDPDDYREVFCASCGGKMKPLFALQANKLLLADAEFYPEHLVERGYPIRIRCARCHSIVTVIMTNGAII